VRHDRYLAYSHFSRVPGDYPADWDGSTYFYRPNAPADYGTLTYVPKNAAGVPTGSAIPATTRPRTGLVPPAQYANDRFQDDFAPPEVRVRKTTYTVGGVGHLVRDLSVFYNYSTTFNPSAARQNIYGSYYGPQVAAEWSTGVRHSLANGRLSATLGYYRGRQTGQVFDFSSTAQSNLNTFATASPTPATGPAPAAGQGNSRGLTPVPRFFDTRDSRNDGYELELVANPTRALRLTPTPPAPAPTRATSPAASPVSTTAKEPVLRQIAADTSVLIDRADEHRRGQHRHPHQYPLTGCQRRRQRVEQPPDASATTSCPAPSSSPACRSSPPTSSPTTPSAKAGSRA
jgi:hypothetical protein